MIENARFNWEEIRTRLREATTRIEDYSRPDTELAALFRKRAELLATELRPETAEGEEILIFRLRNERYALPLKRIAGAITRASLAPVPGGSPEIAGLIHVKGEIRMVWNPARLLGLSEPPPDEDQPQAVLLIRTPDGEQGILADELEDIQTIPDADRRPLPADRSLAAWMTESLVIVLDPDKLLPKQTEENTNE